MDTAFQLHARCRIACCQFIFAAQCIISWKENTVTINFNRAEMTFTIHQCVFLQNELNWSTKCTKMHSKQVVTVSVYQPLCCKSQRSVEVWSLRTVVTVASRMQVIDHHCEAAWMYRPAQLWLCWKVVRVVTRSACSAIITIYIR
jgi:hypothetical protein